jgi:hypothetical protein
MKLKATAIAISSILGVGSVCQPVYAGSDVQKVEFIGMDSPASVNEKTDVYTKARMKVTDKQGKTKTYDLKYHQLMATTEAVKGEVVGGLYDVHDAPLTDSDGQMASDAPDGTSLMDIPGMRAANPRKNRALAMVTQYELQGIAPQ